MWRRAIFKLGNGVSASPSSLQSSLASALQKKYFCLQKFFFVLSYGISSTLLQITISIRFPIHPSEGVHWCSRKKLFELLEASVHWCFEKIIAPKISAYFLAKHPGWCSFLSTLAGFLGIFPKSSLEQLFCRELLAAARYLRNFPEL